MPFMSLAADTAVPVTLDHPLPGMEPGHQVPPFDPETEARARRLQQRVTALAATIDERTGCRRVVGDSPAWRRVLTEATMVAPTNATVLLRGDSGTGKEVIASFIHRASSRDRGPFIAINCAALPEQLLEAELFGYERGAFTGAVQSKPGQLEQANRGTLFLDEVGEMSPSAQAKLLRVLQEREFQRLGGTRVLRTDARIIAATNRDLLRATGNGQFREDLYYRLNVFPITLPALRERCDDILPLCHELLKSICRSLDRPVVAIEREALRRLRAHRWPGNVRELRNTLERAVILCHDERIRAEHLGLTANPSADAALLQPTADAPAETVAVAGALPVMERHLIQQALEKARFNKSKAAKALGLTRHQLYIRMRRYAL
jgi:transcriptional regulator with PAS, ATPase and Fis domain